MSERAENMEWTPDNLRHLAAHIEEMRVGFLMEVDDAGADPYSSQHYLSALAHLDLAERAMTLAAMTQARALAGK